MSELEQQNRSNQGNDTSWNPLSPTNLSLVAFGAGVLGGKMDFSRPATLVAFGVVAIAALTLTIAANLKENKSE